MSNIVKMLIVITFIIPVISWAQSSFVDDFDDGNIAGWTVIEGNAEPSTQHSHSGSHSMKIWKSSWPQSSKVLRDNFSASTGIYEAWFYVAGNVADGWLFFQFIDQDNHYWLACCPNGGDSPGLKLTRRVAGESSVIASVTPTFNMYEWFKVSVYRYTNGDIKVCINDQLQININDTGITESAGFAVGSWQNAYVDDVSFSPESIPSSIYFTDVYDSSGLPNNITTGSHSLQDFDGDGDTDILIGSKLYKNEGNFYFSDITQSTGILDAGDNAAGYWADIDNDGFLDIAIVNIGYSRLYHNSGEGTFENITDAAGFDCSGRSASWIDFDNDGDIDFFTMDDVHSYLLRNNGDFTFTDVTQQSGLYIASNHYYDCIFFDYDNDGDDDVLIAFTWQKSSLFYENNGDGTFTDVTGTIGFSLKAIETGAVGDYDNDGWLDLFLNFYSNINVKLFHNNHDGTFSDVTQEAGIASPVHCGLGCDFIDVDNDGWLDICYSKYDDNDYLWYNNGDGTFTDISQIAGITAVGRTGDCTVADFDSDGDVDILIAPTGWIDYYHLYKNESSASHWIHIDLIGNGTSVNHNAIGCKAKIFTNGMEQIREILGDASHVCQDDFRLEFGLGNATIVDSIIVYWNDGTTQRLFNIEADQVLTILQGEEYPEDGLVAYYPFNGNANDESGNENHGTIYGATLSSDRFGNANCAYDFDGVNDYIQTPLSSNTQPLTISVWFKSDVTNTGESHSIVDSDIWSRGGQSIIFAYDRDNTLDVQYHSGSYDSPFIVDIGTWYHAVATFVPGKIELYVNANFIGSKTFVQGILDGDDFRMGRHNSSDPQWFDGIIDDVRIYNRVLSYDEILELYNENKPITDLFTKITVGDIVNDGANSRGCAWGDYDNDNDLDLFVANDYDQNNFLYTNNGDGTFLKITSGIIVDEGAYSSSVSWGDYDNNSDLDIFVANYENHKNYLYQNNGSGLFNKISNGDIVNTIGYSMGSSWIDYDNDGYLDLFVSNGGSSVLHNNFLFHNNGDGSFTKITTGMIVNDASFSEGCCWGDYDNDGDLDLFVANNNDQNNLLYSNNGDGTFTKLNSGIVVNDNGKSMGGSWGDFDNDGDIDLFVTNWFEQNNFLYTNNGDGTFTKVLSGPVVNDEGHSWGSAWGDFDNDGDLDLYVANAGILKNFLYSNKGDGTFEKISTGIVVEELTISTSVCWGDYNNDGFLDLFVSNGQNQNNCLYVNNGNNNNWINIKCVGTISNYSAIGAKVKVKAIINGKFRWQMREISTQTGKESHNSLNVEFGLGDATIIDSLKVEWPSGIVQILTGLPVNQFLVITESESVCLLGDVNMDKTITPGDALCAFQIYLSSGTPPQGECDTECALYAADATCDKTVTPGDALVIFQAYLDGKNPPLECPPSIELATGMKTTDLQLSLDQANFTSEKEITVSINLNKPQGLKAFGIDLGYPEELMSFVKVASTNLTEGWQALNGKKNLTGVVTIGGFNSEGINSTKPCALVTVTFKMKEKAEGTGDFWLFNLTDDLVKAEVNSAKFNSGIGLAEDREIPASYALEQNYPNPFNMDTEIVYQLPEAVHVNLIIYNLMGQKIKMLVSRNESAGRYEVQWDGRDEQGHEIPSGVYIYRLETSQFSDIKKMIIIK